MEKKKWISIAVSVLLVLGVVLLIAQRMIPVQLGGLMPEDFRPDHGSVVYYEWNDSAELTDEEVQTLWALLDSLEYRYDGKGLGGVMTGELYHLILTQREPPEQVNLFVTKKRGILYLNDREYEMLGDTGPLLEFLSGLQ